MALAEADFLYGARVLDDGAGDDALLVASASGDARAFRVLVDRHAGQAFAVALRLTGSSAEAEDVVQDAFLRVWRHAGSWRAGGARFATWLFQIVLNLCRDRARAGRLRHHLPIEEAFEASDPRPGAEAMLAAQREAQLLLAAVQALPTRQREAVVLTYAAGLSNAEAAAALGVSVGAIESLLVRARRDLRQRLRQQLRSGDDEGG